MNSYHTGFAPRDDEPLYPSLWDGCVGAWHPGLGPTGNTIQEWARGNTGTLTSMDPAAAWKPDVHGYSLLFDATNDYVDLGSATYLTAGQPFSISWWEKVTSDAAGYPSRFILDISGGTNFLVIRIKSDANYKYLAWGRAPSTGTPQRSTAITSPANAIGVWKQFIITGNDPTSESSTDFSVFENTASKAVTGSNSFGSVVQNRFGYDGADSPANCAFSDVRIYNRRLGSYDRMLLARRPGLAYEMNVNDFSVEGSAAAAFSAYWARQRSQLLGGGLNVSA